MNTIQLNAVIEDWTRKYDRAVKFRAELVEREVNGEPWSSSEFEASDDELLCLVQDAAAIFKQMQEAENTPDPGPTDGAAYVQPRNPEPGRIIQVTGGYMPGTYRVQNSDWGIAIRLSDSTPVQINWDAVVWEYES